MHPIAALVAIQHTTSGILVAALKREGYDAGGIIDDERRWPRAKGRRPFGLQAKSASAASELLNIPPGYAAVVLSCIHPIFLATRFT